MENIIDIPKICPKDRISRVAGETLRHEIIEKLKSYDEVIVLFHGKRIASTSFIDEALAKLIDETLNEQEFWEKVILKDITKGDLKLLKSIIRSRKRVALKDLS